MPFGFLFLSLFICISAFWLCLVKISPPPWFSSFWGQGNLINCVPGAADFLVRMEGELSCLSADGCSPKHCTRETTQTVPFVLLQRRALVPTVQRHLASLAELEFIRAYEIWVMLNLLICASLGTTILYPYSLHLIFEVFMDTWQLTCFHFVTGFIITNLSCSVF